MNSGEIVGKLPDFDDHEDVLFAEDPATGLRAIIAVHNTFRGPGVGGTRLWHYEDDRSALTDALRLSRGMTYKNAVSELPFGGGKAVIMSRGAAGSERRALMRAFGRMVSSLQGRYFTAEDVGTSCDDMAEIRRATDFIFGLRGTSGDPSPHTARGVFLGIQESVEERYGVRSLDGLRVIVQGVGNVGYHLCALLRQHGAELLVTDLNKAALERCEQEFGARIVAPDRCYDCDAEVYAPCALGATIHERTLDRLRVEVIAGAANNQLASDDVAELVRQKEILYAPDYVINAGGIINISCETGGSYDPEEARLKVAKIGPRLREIFRLSRAEGRDTQTIANRMARERFAPRANAGSGFRVLGGKMVETRTSAGLVP